MEEGQTAENSPKPLGSLFTRPDAPVSAGSEETPSPTTEPESVEKETPKEAPPAEEKKLDAGKQEEGEQSASEVKVEAKPEGEKPKEEAETVGNAKPVIDWESDENPFKQKVSAIEKQYNDTRQWARQEAAQRQKLQQQLDIINKKLDGTYDPNVDEPKPDPEAVVLEAEAKGKMAGSLDAAYLHYGKGDKKQGQEFVDKEITRYNELFSENVTVQGQVWSSPAPIFTALKILRDFDLTQKYGTNDAAELIEKGRAEAKSELEQELTEKIRKEVVDSIAMKNKAPTGINGARAATK